MESVVLKARDHASGEWVDVEHAGWAAAGDGGAAALRRADQRATCGWSAAGPALFAEDQRVLQRVRRRGADRLRGPAAERAGAARRARSPTVDRQRTALLAAVGHDLRTPLAGIKAAVSTLRQTDVDWSDDERDELLATIEESADRLDGGRRATCSTRAACRPARSASRREPVALDEVVGAALLGAARAPRRSRGRRARGPAARARRPRPARARARQPARQRAAPRRRRRRSRSRAVAGAEQRQARGRRPRPGRAAPSSASGCSSRSSASTTAARAGSASACRSRAASSRRWTARWSPTRTPGGGLTMRIRLPLAGARSRGRAVTRVLVVDDEPGLRRALAINLRARDYEVDVAADGAAALAAAVAAAARRGRARPRPARHGRHRA